LYPSWLIGTLPLAAPSPATLSDEQVLIEQGLEVHRPSCIFVRTTKEDNRQDNQVVNVRVGGNCVEVLRGEVTLAI
jgi:predicted PhzF superfamily epimerase YddE/YHI9